MDNSFWNDFLANFLSDLLAGAILAVLLALPLNWWVNRKLNELARSQQRKEEEKAELKKAIRYLELLKKEIDDLLNELPNWVEVFKSTGWGIEFWIPTPGWDILQPSGELPRLLDPGLIESLTLFYDDLVCAKRGK